MGDWALVVVGGALASLLAGLIHRVVTGWRAGGPSALDASGTSQTLRHGEASQSTPGAALAKSRAEILRSEIEVLQASRRGEIERRLGDWFGIGMGTVFALWGVLGILVLRDEGRPWTSMLTPAAICLGGVLLAIGSRWIGRRQVRRIDRRLRDLHTALDLELGLASRAE